MNFDYYKPYKLSLIEGNQFSVMVDHTYRYGRPLGVTKEGLAMNMQYAPYCEAAKYRRNVENPTNIRTMIDMVLTGALKVQQIEPYLSQHTLINRRNNSVQSMVADKDGGCYILCPGKGELKRQDFLDNFAVLTNFSPWEKRPLGRSGQVISCERYRTAYHMLQEAPVDISRAFAILEAVKRTKGKLRTIFSLVARLDTDEVYFCLYGDFKRRYRFSFVDNMVRTERGFLRSQEKKLTARGVRDSVLMQWE